MIYQNDGNYFSYKKKTVGWSINLRRQICTPDISLHCHFSH